MNVALLVSINNYPGNPLRGCLNDQDSMRSMLTGLGWSPLHIRTLTDQHATKNNILRCLTELVTRAQEGDHLVFHYSGHGSQVPCLDGDEQDGMDEILVPYGFNWAPDNYITDDELRQIILRLPAGATLDVILDCCHSGTGLRAPDDIVARFIPPPFPIPTDGRWPRAILKDLCQPGVALFAGARSNQTAADAWIPEEKKYQGAMTYAFCRALKQQHNPTRERIHNTIDLILNSEGYDQEPQLECDDETRAKEIFT